MRLRQFLLSTTAVIAIAGGAYFTADKAQAADVTGARRQLRPPAAVAPAVDGFNAKWDALTGELNRKRLYGSRGALSMPLGGQFGLQVDVTGGSLERRGFGSIGGHLFWRNPSQGLVGLYVNHVHWNEFGGVHVTHVAAEGEIYAGPWTVQAIVGAEFGNSASNIVTATSVTPPAIGFPGAVTTATLVQTYDVKTRFMDQVNLKYYLTENWDAYVGHRYLGGKNALALGSEFALPLGGGVMGSAFVEARLGSENFEGVWGGLKVYFGRKDKSLIRRHREDDPYLWDTLWSILGNFHQNISGATEGIAPLPSPFVCLPSPEADGDCIIADGVDE